MHRWRRGLRCCHVASTVERRPRSVAERGTVGAARGRPPIAAHMAVASARSGNIERFELSEMLMGSAITVLPPQGYLEMLGLMANARVVLTDSGGIQEETTALAVPCLTMRENTERPITVDQGTNTLVGRSLQRTLACVDAIVSGRRQARPDPRSCGTGTPPIASPPTSRTGSVGGLPRSCQRMTPLRAAPRLQAAPRRLPRAHGASNERA